jgi:DNA-3-methyladenine glycosylase II
MAHRTRGFDIAKARSALARRDPVLGAAMRRIGPLPLPEGWEQPFDTVDALARSILYQQLSGKAAATIVGRVESAIGSPRLHAESLARMEDDRLRACGVSGAKLRALRDLSARALAGEVPSSRALAFQDEDSIIERLTAIRGVGRWSVEMLLIFRLGRPDVLPLGDLGVRRGAQRLDGQDSLPSPNALALRGEAWGPWRSLAAMYLWKLADEQ